MGQNEKIAWIEKPQLNTTRPKFRVGDTVQVFVKISEEGKTRIQMFEGLVIRRKGGGLKGTFTVRRVAFGEGMERTFLLHSPFIEKIRLSRRGKVRRAKLYYLRKKVGKGARIQAEWGKTEAENPEAPQATGEVRPETQAPTVQENSGS